MYVNDFIKPLSGIRIKIILNVILFFNFYKAFFAISPKSNRSSFA